MSTDFGKIKSKRYNTIAEIYTTIKTDGAVMFLYEEGNEKGIKFVFDEDNVDDFISALETAIAHYKHNKCKGE